MFAGHFRKDDMEGCLVVVRDESIVEYTQSFVAEQPEHLLIIAYCSRISLQQTYIKT